MQVKEREKMEKEWRPAESSMAAYLFIELNRVQKFKEQKQNANKKESSQNTILINEKEEDEQEVGTA